MDSRGRPFYLIDRERVSQETYHDSFRKSENVRTYQSRDKESGRFGSFRPEFYERREALRESERISQARREPGRIPTRIAPAIKNHPTFLSCSQTVVAKANPAAECPEGKDPSESAKSVSGVEPSTSKGLAVGKTTLTIWESTQAVVKEKTA